MKRIACLTLLCLFLAAGAAHAAGVRYLEDPVYVKINKDDELPMQDLMTLAREGDPRAQYILGDLYSKGKGGLAKNRVKAHYWFEISARHGFTPAFIRLGALAKHSHDYVEACQWYKIDADHTTGREAAWSKSEFQRLSRSLSPAALKEAVNGAHDWLESQRQAMAVILNDEETARNTLPPPDLGDDDKDKDKKDKKDKKDTKGPKEDQTAVTEKASPRKETHYNE